jgi:hypothetical protein
MSVHTFTLHPAHAVANGGATIATPGAAQSAVTVCQVGRAVTRAYQARTRS